MRKLPDVLFITKDDCHFKDALISAGGISHHLVQLAKFET
jgi:hypothetical protein